jgi:hypothetical protein
MSTTGVGSKAIALAVLGAAAALALAACGGRPQDAADADAPPTTAQPADVSSGEDGAESPGGADAEADAFVGLTLPEATRLAEAQGRPSRVGRLDGEDLALTADLVPGRVTFVVDGGVVTGASIERSEEAAPAPPSAPEDPVEAGLVAGAVARIVTVDNSFGGGDPFDRVEVADVVGADAARPVAPLARELIAEAIQPLAEVEFIPDAEAAIARYFEGPPRAVAVVSVDDVRVDGDRAEVDLTLWCGSLCGVSLTYEATLGGGGWEILGTTGPIAVS